MVNKEVVIILKDENEDVVTKGSLVLYRYNKQDCIGSFEGFVGDGKIKIKSVVTGEAKNYLLKSIDYLYLVREFQINTPDDAMDAEREQEVPVETKCQCGSGKTKADEPDKTEADEEPEEFDPDEVEYDP